MKNGKKVLLIKAYFIPWTCDFFCFVSQKLINIRVKKCSLPKKSIFSLEQNITISINSHVVLTTSEMTCRSVVSMFWSSSTFCSKIHINSPTYCIPENWYDKYLSLPWSSRCQNQRKYHHFSESGGATLYYYYKYKLTAELETDEEWHGSMELSHTVFLSHRMYWFIKNTQVNHSEKGGCSM